MALNELDKLLCDSLFNPFLSSVCLPSVLLLGCLQCAVIQKLSLLIIYMHMRCFENHYMRRGVAGII